jgi:hypothetical protein
MMKFNLEANSKVLRAMYICTMQSRTQSTPVRRLGGGIRKARDRQNNVKI